MAHEYEINAALNEHLVSMPDVPPIAWPNAQFDPVGSPVWFEVAQLPRITDAPFLGNDSAQDYGGIYQVSVMTTLGQYETSALQAADALINHFARGILLRSGDTYVRIRNAYRSAGLVDGSRYAIPVSIRYRTVL